MSARLLWPELGPDDEAGGWLAEVDPGVTSTQVLDAIARRHPMDGWNGMPGRWVFVREVLATTGLWGDQQRFDALAVGLVPSVKYARVVYEIKVSRADWLRELRPRVDKRVTSRWEDDGSEYGAWRSEVERTERPGRKWDAAVAVSTEFWIAAPPHVVQLHELPPEAGLVEVRPRGPSRELRPKVVRPAPVRETPIPDAGFWSAVLRRVAERPAR